MAGRVVVHLARSARVRWKTWRSARPVHVICLVERMGDLVACEPVPGELRRSEPRAWVIWICDRRFAPLVAAFRDVDEIWTVTCLREVAWLSPALAGWRVLNLHPEGKCCGTCGGRFDTGRIDRSITTENYYHFGDLRSAFSRVAGLRPDPLRAPRLAVTQDSALAFPALGLPARFVVFHCQSDEASRNWKASHWRLLARRLSVDAGIAVVEIGGKSALLAGTEGIIDLSGKLTLFQTAAVLARACLFVGIDSGPAHLANAVGVPGVILLGRYRAFTRYIPYSGAYGASGEKVTVLQHWRECLHLPFHTVRRAVDGALAGEFGPGAVPLTRPEMDVLTGRWSRRWTLDITACHGRVLARHADQPEEGPSLEILRVTDLRSACSLMRPSTSSNDRCATLHDRMITLVLADGAFAEGEASRAMAALTETEEASDRFFLFASLNGDVEGELFATSAGGHLTLAGRYTRDADRFVFQLGSSWPENWESPCLRAWQPTGTSEGSIDEVRMENGRIVMMSGWSLIKRPMHRPPDRLFLGQRTEAGVLPVHEITDWRRERPDVAAHFQDPDVLMCGWHVSLPTPWRGEILVLAADDWNAEMMVLGSANAPAD